MREKDLDGGERGKKLSPLEMARQEPISLAVRTSKKCKMSVLIFVRQTEGFF